MWAGYRSDNDVDFTVKQSGNTHIKYAVIKNGEVGMLWGSDITDDKIEEWCIRESIEAVKDVGLGYSCIPVFSDMILIGTDKPSETENFFWSGYEGVTWSVSKTMRKLWRRVDAIANHLDLDV